jgi:methyltransferase (TIGR00027 family)
VSRSLKRGEARAGDAEAQSVEAQPSQSAQAVTLFRALRAHEDDPPRRGPDTLAEIFLTDDVRGRLIDAASRTELRGLFPPDVYSTLHARTVWLDSNFENALAEHVPQIVLLGAGYDSRAYRFTDRLGATRIFELDALPTQKRKRQQLAAAGLAEPPQVTYIPTNFKSDPLEELLREAGYDRTKRARFLWEGVIYYLPADAVATTLDFISSHSPARSTLCFDYMTEARPSPYAGEPFKFALEADTLPAYLAKHGLTLLEDDSPAVIEQKYLTPGESSRPHVRFARARVTG